MLGWKNDSRDSERRGYWLGSAVGANTGHGNGETDTWWHHEFLVRSSKTNYQRNCPWKNWTKEVVAQILFFFAEGRTGNTCGQCRGGFRTCSPLEQLSHLGQWCWRSKQIYIRTYVSEVGNFWILVLKDRTLEQEAARVGTSCFDDTKHHQRRRVLTWKWMRRPLLSVPSLHDSGVERRPGRDDLTNQMVRTKFSLHFNEEVDKSLEHRACSPIRGFTVWGRLLDGWVTAKPLWSGTGLFGKVWDWTHRICLLQKSMNSASLVQSEGGYHAL